MIKLNGLDSLLCFLIEAEIRKGGDDMDTDKAITQEQPDVRVRNTPPFKLKDKTGKRYVAINLKKQFGFVPEVVIIEKAPGQNNVLIMRAIMTEEALKQEEKMKSEMVKRIKQIEPLANK